MADPSPIAGAALSILSVTVVLLFVVTVGFSVYAIILRLVYERTNRLWARLSARWSAPVLAAIVDSSAIPAVHGMVEARYRLYFVNFVLDYSQRVRGEELNTLRELAEPYLDVIAARSGHRRPEVRLRSIQTLGTLGLPRYEEVVLRALKDPEDSVAAVAARALARPEYARHAPLVFEALPRFSGWKDLFLAAMLAEMGPEVLPELRKRLAEGSDPEWMRTVVAIALRLQLDPRGADIAVGVLESTGDVDLIVALLRLLAELGRPEHLPVIHRFVDSERPIIRSQALHALGALGSLDEAPLLERGLDDVDPWASANAARGLLSIGGTSLIDRVSSLRPEHAVLLNQVALEVDV